jgi:hypothetical protein
VIFPPNLFLKELTGTLGKDLLQFVVTIKSFAPMMYTTTFQPGGDIVNIVMAD